MWHDELSPEDVMFDEFQLQDETGAEVQFGSLNLACNFADILNDEHADSFSFSRTAPTQLTQGQVLHIQQSEEANVTDIDSFFRNEGMDIMEPKIGNGMKQQEAALLQQFAPLAPVFTATYNSPPTPSHMMQPNIGSNTPLSPQNVPVSPRYESNVQMPLNINFEYNSGYSSASSRSSTTDSECSTGSTSSSVSSGVSSGYNTPNWESASRVNHQIYTLCMYQSFQGNRMTEMPESEFLERVTVFHNLVMTEFQMEKSDTLVMHMLNTMSKKWTEVMQQLLQQNEQLEMMIRTQNLPSDRAAELYQLHIRRMNAGEADLQNCLVFNEAQAIYFYQVMLYERTDAENAEAEEEAFRKLRSQSKSPVINLELADAQQRGVAKKKKKKDKKSKKKSRALPSTATTILLVRAFFSF
jgi:hypothetical protein